MADRKPLERISDVSTDWIDEPDGTVTIETYQDAEQILEDNKRRYNAHGDSRTFGKINSDGFHKAASIPVTVWEQWVKEDPEIAKNPKLLFKKLNDPEFRYFKTTPVRL
jgi:hypothetical protein